MTLKRYFLLLMAALAVFACTPGANLDDGWTEPEQQGTDEPVVPESEDDTTVELEEPGSITSSGAKLYAGYSRAFGTPEEKGFRWGIEEELLYKKLESESVVSGRAGMFSAEMTGLQPNTVYYYCAYVVVNGKTYRSEVASFRTKAAEGGYEDTPRPYLGCYEIPATNLTSDAVQTGTETWGSTKWYKYNTTNSDQKLVVHTYKNSANKVVRTYVLLFDRTKKAPLWDCTAFNNGAWPRNNVGRNDSWKYDPALDQSWQNTGVSGYSKGHLTASNDRQDNLDANHQTFYYSNQAPQFQNGFNDGVWNTLENNIQAASPSGSDTLYVVNGLLYEDNNTSGGVPVPSHFYKCIMSCSFNSSGTMTAAKGAAYIYTNEKQSLAWNHSSYTTTIDAIESRTGFDFFPNVPDNLEEEAESGRSKYTL